MSGTYLDPIIISDDEPCLACGQLDHLRTECPSTLIPASPELALRRGATVMNHPQMLSREPAAPVPYWQRSYHMPLLIHVRLNLTLTPHGFALLLFILWTLQQYL